MKVRLGLVLMLGLTGWPAAWQTAQPQDGGTREVSESIEIPPVTNAPFTATLATEWSRPMAGSGSITLVNERRIARDSSGRVYQERWLLVPKDGQIKSQMNAIQIADPNLHRLFTCMTFRKVCDLTAYRPDGPLTAERSPAKKRPGLTVENLGTKNLFGEDTLGTRETMAIDAGAVGNDRPIAIVLEYWHSPRLAFNLESVRSDPRIGTQTFTIKELEAAEPDPALFSVPEGYQVVDQQTNPPVAW